MTGELRFEVENQIATIEFYHPKGNSLPSTLLNQLAETIIKSGNDPSVKVVLLRSRGEGAFCAGASFGELLSIQSEEEANSFFMGFGKLILAIKNCPKFVITRVQGKAVGGGVGIIAACDYAIGNSDASIKLSELSIGFGPFVIAPAVIRKIGLSAFSSLTIDSANWKSAQWALDMGLFNLVAKDHDSLDEECTTLCNSLAGSSPEAMKSIKKMLWEGYENLEEVFEERSRTSGILSQTETTQKILSEFKSAK